MNIGNLAVKFGSLAKIGKNVVLTHRTELLYGGSVVSTLAAVVLAGRGGYQAGQHVMCEEIKTHEPLSNKEIALLTWRYYVPAAAATVGSVGATTGLHLAHLKDKKALAAATLAAADQVKTEANAYKKEVESVISDEQKEEIDSRLSADQEVEKLYLVRDAYSGRDIYSNRRIIEDAVNEVNNHINASGDVDLNTFYNYAGFSDIPEGLNHGWSGAFVYLSWSSEMRDDGQPVSMFTFRTSPEKGFDRTH